MMSFRSFTLLGGAGKLLINPGEKRGVIIAETGVLTEVSEDTFIEGVNKSKGGGDFLFDLAGVLIGNSTLCEMEIC
jgi:hypothetical protein